MANLIDKAVVVTEIEKQRNSYIAEPNKYKVLSRFLNFIDNLEVKEVDFEKIWKEYFKYRGDVATVNVKHLAKHFFALGIKA